MREAHEFKPEQESAELRRIVAKATENAKFKNARLRLMKERNQLYLSTKRDELDFDDLDDEFTKEL